MNGFKKIGEKIKFYREKRGLSIDNISIATQINKSRFEKIENGDVVYQLNTLSKIANILEVDLPELLDF